MSFADEHGIKEKKEKVAKKMKGHTNEMGFVPSWEHIEKDNKKYKERLKK